jgi:glucokinase
MDNRVILAFDVGGTYIKAGVVDAKGIVLKHSVSQYEARAHEGMNEILDHFAAITAALIESAGGAGCGSVKVCGIGYAFPGPFNYEKGISYIRGLDKFESLYGVNIGEQLRGRFQSNPPIARALAPNWRLAFENDASLFALGEAVYGQASRAERAVCLTIGTGLGSGFVEKGRLIKSRQDVPEQGWVYNLPYEDGIADDFISRRGMLKLALQMGIDLSNGRDVRELAKAAFGGDALALELFRQFGSRMAHILASPLRMFQPDAVVLGGQISKSGELFVPAFVQSLHEQGVDIKVKLSEDTLYSTFQGIYHLIGNSFTPLMEDHEEIYAYIREWENEKWLVVLNFTEGEVEFSLEEGERPRQAELMIGNYELPTSAADDISRIALRPYEARVYSCC